MRAGSKEYVKAKVIADVDPTIDGVEMAITAFNTDWVEGDFQTAEWDPVRETTARLLAGPLAKGRYFVWVRVTDTPEIPIMHAGTLVVE